MKHLKVLSILMAIGLSAIGADSDFAKTIPCDIESASTTSLLTLPLSQGTTPLIAAYQQKGGRAITADTNVTAVLRFAPSATNALWVSVTNYTTSGSSYLFQMPSLGTNAVNWVYTIFYIRNGYTYWTGNGRLDIARSEAAGNPLSWSMPNDIATAINTHNLSTASHADKVTTNRTITIGGVTGQLSSNLVFTSTQTQQVYTATAGSALTAETVTGAQSNLIATAWQNPASATNWTWTSDGIQITLTGYTGPNAVVIPESLDGLPVTGFGMVFSHNSDITSVIGGNKIVLIGNDAFTGCWGLTSVNLPAVTSIGAGAFTGCDNLVSVVFTEATTIGNGAFQGCDGITTLIFPSATSIGSESFRFMSALTSVNLPAVTSIGAGAFRECASLASVSFAQHAPVEVFALYTDSPSVTNYVTNPTATGWGATFGGMPVVRMPIEAETVNAGTVISITSTTTGTNSAGFFQGDGSLLTGLPSSGISAATASNIVRASIIFTNGTTLADGVYSGTNGVFFTKNSTNYWVLLP